MLTDVVENAQRKRHFLYYKSPDEAALEKLPQAQLFSINGNVKDPKSWSAYSVGNENLEPLGTVDFGTRDALKFIDLAFSVEKEGISSSWIISSPATVTGAIPEGRRMSIKCRLMSPHLNQQVKVRFNGRNVATWNIDDAYQWSEREAVVDVSISEAGRPGRIEFLIGKIAPMNEKNDNRSVGVLVDWIRFDVTDRAARGNH